MLQYDMEFILLLVLVSLSMYKWMFVIMNLGNTHYPIYSTGNCPQRRKKSILSLFRIVDLELKDLL